MTDKEKLEEAKRLYQTANADQRYVLESLFPELKEESEDEKIRKELIDIVAKSPITFAFEDKNKVLAWLEKQKPIQNINKEDEEVRQYIVKIMEQRDINVPMVQKAIAWLENIPYTIDHEKREGFHLGYKAALEKQGETSPILSNSSNIGKDEQKPAWSIKEKLMLNDIIETTERSNIFKEDYQRELIDWLKSLKERYSWKPSDEQMKALDSVIDEYDGYPEFDSLVSLKNDLSKL